MFSIAVKQMKYAKKEWIVTISNFIVLGIVLSIVCSINILTRVQYPGLVGSSTQLDPTPGIGAMSLFSMLTFLLVSGEMIRQIIYKHRDEYIIWQILGAKPTQLSFFVAIQCSIMAAIGGGMGYFLSLPISQHIIYWLIDRRGSVMVDISFSGIVLVSVLLLLILYSFLVGYFQSICVFHKVFKDYSEFERSKRIDYGLIRKVIIFVGLCYIIYNFYEINQIDLTNIYDNYLTNWEAKKEYFNYWGNSLLSMISISFCISAIILFSGSILFRGMSYVASLIMPKQSHVELISASGKVFSDNKFYKSLVIPIIIGILTVTTMIESAIHFARETVDLADAGASGLDEIIHYTLVMWLGAPILIIICNVITITILLGREGLSEIKKLLLLGFSKKMIVVKKNIEIGIYVITVFLISVFGNLVVWIYTLNSSILLQMGLPSFWNHVIKYPLIGSILTGLLMLIVFLPQTVERINNH